MVEFIETVEKRNGQPLNRFVDLSALDAVDLNFEFVFHVALGRRLSAAPKPAVKSAFYVTSPGTMHYASCTPRQRIIRRSMSPCSRIAPLQRSGSAFRSRRCRHERWHLNEKKVHKERLTRKRKTKGGTTLMIHFLGKRKS